MQSTNQFDITPSETQLAEMSREMRFFPSTVQLPQFLCAEDVTSYNERGFVSPVEIFSVEEIAVHRQYFDELLEQALAAGQGSYSISSAHLRYPAVYDLLREPRIVAAVADLLGDDVIGWGSHYFCKLPGDGKAVDWHQDATYWPLTPTKTLTVWLAIDDADEANGCMEFVAGSHLHGALEHLVDDGGGASVLGRGIPDAGRLGEVVLNPLRAGQISIHSDLLVHGSRANASQRRRCGLTLRYCTPDVVAGLQWDRKGVVVRGGDRWGHWQNPARPTLS